MGTGPFDADELVEWAEMYGHPEEWAKRAQAAHSRAEKAEKALSDIADRRWQVNAGERSQHPHVQQLQDLARKALRLEAA